MKYALFAILPILLIVSACDSNTENPNAPVSPNATAPTTATAILVGPVLTKVDTDVAALIDDVQVDVIDSITEDDSNPQGQSSNNNLVLYATGIFDDGEDLSNTITYSASDTEVACDVGGTYDITGTLDVVADTNSNDGTANGTLFINYNDCQSFVTLVSQDGECQVLPTLNGAVQVVISNEFSIGSSESDSSVSTRSFVEYDVSPINDAPLQMNIGSNPVADHSVVLNYFTCDSGCASERSGYDIFSGDLFDLSQVEAFLEELDEDTVCPAAFQS